jgi:hypothetical protein
VISNQILPKHDGSIDEMANTLLDDTARVSESTKRVAVARLVSPAEQDLPQLPHMRSNRDDAWAWGTAHEVTAIGETNELSENSTSQFFNSAQQLAPSIPRRVSFHGAILFLISQILVLVSTFFWRRESFEFKTEAIHSPLFLSLQ